MKPKRIDENGGNTKVGPDHRKLMMAEDEGNAHEVEEVRGQT